MKRRIVVVATILGLLGLLGNAETASNVKIHSNGLLAQNHHPTADPSKSAEISYPLEKIPATTLANSLGFDENSPDPRGLTCLQLQIMDEVDGLSEADCD